MGRNDLCFCGSGKKQKKCHPNTNDKSVIANLLSVFHQLDIEHQQCLNTICHNGCGDCCVDNFKISSVEFFTILHYLLDNNKSELLELSITRSLEKQDNRPKNNKCIFFDEHNCNCSIYQVRPITCRKYGYTDLITDCPKILNSGQEINFIKNSNVDCTTNILIFNNRYAPAPHEIAYWFSLYRSKNFKTKRMQDLFECSKFFTIEEFYRLLTIQNNSFRSFDINEF